MKKCLHTLRDSVESFKSVPEVACDESLDPDSDFCENQIDEVSLLVTNNTTNTNYTQTLNIFVTEGVNWQYESIDYSNTSDGGSSSEEPSGQGSAETFPCDDAIHGCDRQIDEPCDIGYIKDSNGDCIKKPCIGDPIVNPEVTSSGSSGKRGGTWGCTRNGVGCGPLSNKKKHDGLDISANLNSPLFALYTGRVVKKRASFTPGQYLNASYGNYVVIACNYNGKTISIKYNHLNQVDVILGQTINAGDIIGLSGNTGNANTNGVIPHVHIQVYDENNKSVNPENYLSTKFDDNKNAINNCN